MKKHLFIIALLYLIIGAHPVNLQAQEFSLPQAEVLILAPAKIDNHWGYIDPNGEFAIPPSYDFANDFVDGLAAILLNGKWGYVNHEGKEIISPQFDNAYNFSHGLARIKIGEKWGYIDTKGKVVIPTIYEQVTDFSDGLAVVKLGEKYGYINMRGQDVILPQFDEAYNFVQGIALIEKNGQLHYVNKQNSFVGHAFFDDASYCFVQDLAVVKVNGKYGYINKEGNFVIEPQFEYAEHFADDIAVVVKNREYGFINPAGEYLINPALQNAKHFSEGLAAVQSEGKYGYLNKDGRYKIPSQFDDAYPFINGLAKVVVNKKYGFINREGNFVVEPQYDWAFDFSEGVAAVFLDGKFGYVNLEGQYSIEPHFEEVGKFSKIGIYKAPAQKPVITFQEPMSLSTTVEKSEYVLRAKITSIAPMLEYLVFVNDRLHDLSEVTDKGTVFKRFKRSITDGYSVNIETTLQLDDGNNEIYIKAVNANGTTNSEVREIIYTPSIVIERPDLYVLSVGISDYQYTQYNLNYADDDANDFANAFDQQQRIQRGRRLFDYIHVKTLVDAQATVSNIKREILDMKSKVEEDDLFVLHISSHGEVNPVGDLYIRTYDTDQGVNYLDVNGLANKWLVKTLKDFNCTVIQFFDACHSGKGGKDIAMKGASDIAVRELKEALKSKAVYFFASSSSQQLSQERKEWKNGAFTKAILDCFDGKRYQDQYGRYIFADLDNDGYINTNELNEYISTVVRLLTNGSQRPKATFQNAEPINLFVVD